MLDKLKKLFLGKQEEKPENKKAVPPPTKKQKKEQPKRELTAKERATLNNEPYIEIVSLNVDPNNVHNGVFELDFNDKFVLNLVRHGYKLRDDDTDAVIVDRWFTEVCRTVVLEMFEQEQADPANRVHRDMRVVRRKNLGDGRSEVS
jgi:hypothetical protein